MVSDDVRYVIYIAKTGSFFLNWSESGYETTDDVADCWHTWYKDSAHRVQNEFVPDGKVMRLTISVEDI